MLKIKLYIAFQTKVRLSSILFSIVYWWSLREQIILVSPVEQLHLFNELSLYICALQLIMVKCENYEQNGEIEDVYFLYQWSKLM